MRLFLTLSFAVFVALAYAELWPEKDARVLTERSGLALTGNWGFIYGDWVHPEDLLSQWEQSGRVVTLPSYLSDLEPAGNSSELKKATYLIRLRNLDKVFRRPALEMDQVRDAWQAFWVTDDGNFRLLGGSGNLTSDAYRDKRDVPYLLELPNYVEDGTLLIWTSTHRSNRGGLYGSPVIEEQESLLKKLMGDISVRSFVIGIGIFVVVQNLVFYLRRRDEKTALLLAHLGFAGMMRSALASNYMDFFVDWAAFSEWQIRLEYLLVMWPVAAATHFISHIFPTRWHRQIVLGAWLIMAIASIASLTLPVDTMTSHLNYYQLTAFAMAAFALALIINGLVSRMEWAKYFMLSVLPLLIAMINDFYSALSPGYDFYVAEYGLIAFLFLQTQIQATRFITALDTAEHLTANLQAEVDRKTKELSIRNSQLELRADELQAQHKEIKLLSETDHLTGLYNRQSLESRTQVIFDMALAFGHPMTVVMMDLDHFKSINDQYGHLVGDECLVHVASYLRALNFRKRDILARYGGEEIILVLSDVDMETALPRIQRICEGLPKQPVTGDHEDIYLTASFGVSDIASAEASEFQTLVECADAALYLAKQRGRNRVECYSPNAHLPLDISK